MRRSGRTTRIVDEAVQEFFTNKKVLCADHYSEDGKESSRRIQKMIVSRLQFEHSLREGKDFRRGFNQIDQRYEIISLN